MKSTSYGIQMCQYDLSFVHQKVEEKKRHIKYFVSTKAKSTYLSPRLPLKVDLSSLKTPSPPQMKKVEGEILGDNNFLSSPESISQISELVEHGDNSSSESISQISELIEHGGNNLLSLVQIHSYGLSSFEGTFSPSKLVELHISPLSELIELSLFRCSNLQTFSSLKTSIWNLASLKTSILRLSYLKSLSLPQRNIVEGEIPCDIGFFFKYIEDRIYHEEPFEIRSHFPHKTRIPNWCRHWMSGTSVSAQLPVDTEDSNSWWMGFALFVAFEILENDNFDKSWESRKTVCHFVTHEGRCLEHPLIFQAFRNLRVGSPYGLCWYEPRGGHFARQLNKGSRLFQASVSTNRPDLQVKGCGIHLISKQDAADFVNNLISIADYQRPGFELWSTLESSGDEMVLVYDGSMGTSMNFPL